jgi:hypothetical protein
MIKQSMPQLSSVLEQILLSEFSQTTFFFQIGNAPMRSLLLVAVIMLSLPALPASADSLSYDAGVGFHHSEGSTLNLLRYQHEARPLFGYSGYWEAMFASWNGPDNAKAVGLARGIRLMTFEDQYLGLTGGLSHITRTTSNLGQPFEFYGRVAYVIHSGKAIFSIGYVHFSSGKFFFRWSGPNYGENFVTLSVGMSF